MPDDETEKPPEVPKAKPKERVVWFSCRASRGCEGKMAAIVFSKGIPGHSSVTRYRCLTCGKAWHVQM